MSDTFLLMTPKPPKDERLHIMITKSMKDDITLAVRAPGFKSEADVVRYALEQVLPGLLEEAAKRYAGRTRILVDTAEPAPIRHVVTHREPARLRDAGPDLVHNELRSVPFDPFPAVDLKPYIDQIETQAKEIAALVDLTGVAWGDATPSSIAEREHSLEVLRQHGIIPDSTTDDAPSA